MSNDHQNKISAWDTEDFSTVSGTTDPRVAARVWNDYIAENFHEHQDEYLSSLTTPARVSQYWSLSWVKPETLEDESPMDLIEHPTRSDLVPVWIVLHGGEAFLPLGENA